MGQPIATQFAELEAKDVQADVTDDTDIKTTVITSPMVCRSGFRYRCRLCGRVPLCRICNLDCCVLDDEQSEAMVEQLLADTTADISKVVEKPIAGNADLTPSEISLLPHPPAKGPNGGRNAKPRCARRGFVFALGGGAVCQACYVRF